LCYKVNKKVGFEVAGAAKVLKVKFLYFLTKILQTLVILGT